MSTPSNHIRPTRPDEAARLREIEWAAGQRFRDVGMADIAEAEPMPVERIVAYADAGRSWVAVNRDDTPIGYALVDVVDDCAHVEQISVHPDYQGRGLGRRLLDAIDGWAADHAMPALTLSTFVDVPWNGPLYVHLGFRGMAEDELGPGLRAVLEDEARHGLDVTKRMCMRRERKLQRILVVGSTNAGKTTMARRLGGRLDVPHVELDALFWEPGWTEAADDVFRQRVRDATAGDRWIVCGNYSRAQDVMWSRADTLVWLDLPLRTILRRAITRTIRRSILRTDLWGTGNREYIRNLWSADDSLYKWAKQNYASRRERYTAVLSDPDSAHLTVVRLTSPRAARAWLRGVPRVHRTASPR